MVKEWKRLKDTGRSTVRVLPWDTDSLPVPWPLSSPNPSSAKMRRRSSRGCAWRRAGVKWVETMSFVAQAAWGGGGTGKRYWIGLKKKKRLRIEERKKVLSRQHSRATKDPDCAAEIINNEMRKMNRKTS